MPMVMGHVRAGLMMPVMFIMTVEMFMLAFVEMVVLMPLTGADPDA